MAIELEYVYGPGYISSDGFDIYEKRGAKLTSLMSIHPRAKSSASKQDAEDAAQCLCLLMAGGVTPDALKALLACSDAKSEV